MPIIMKDYQWTESETRLDLSLPQKGIRSNKIDVMVTNLYVKVNYSPYFFDVHLKHEIDDCKTRVVMADNTITLHLIKEEPILWETLVNPASKDSSRRKELVAAAYKYHEEKVKSDTDKRANVKAEQNKMALRTAMDVDSGEKERIESVKQAERDKVAKEMDEWQNLDDDEKERRYLKANKTRLQPEDSETNASEDHTTDDVSNDTAIVSESTVAEDNLSHKPDLADERARKFEKIKHNLANPLKSGKDERKAEKKPCKEEKPMWETSGPRQQTEITVSFTPRFFPSAARESTAADEEAWFEKNVKAQTVLKAKDADTKEDERNPVWLSDKAGVFYKMGNFPAAINAYSEAIKISPELPKLYINRASCYIVLNLYDDAVIDCTRAMDLLTPPVEANRLSRVRTLAKRGSAFCQLGSLNRALEDYELASKLSPDNEPIKRDLEVLRAQTGANTSLQEQSTITVS